MPGTMLDLVPHMPARLKQLRQEVGWTLENVAEKLGLAQRGVVSNWEATNQRHRIPDIGNLLILQRWYGVSLDYLLGHPGADRDSPAVKQGKRALKLRLRETDRLERLSPSDRARLVVKVAVEVAPEAFFMERIAVWLLLRTSDLEALCQDDATWAGGTLERLGALGGLKPEWFFAQETELLLEALA